MNIPDDLRYTTEHEWVRRDDGRIVVGITDFAQSAMGDVVHVDRPTIGSTVSAGDSLAEIESTKSVSEVYAPVSGTVVEMNEALAKSPELVNDDPYGKGWILALEPADPSEIDKLLTAGAYAEVVAAAED